MKPKHALFPAFILLLIPLTSQATLQGRPYIGMDFGFDRTSSIKVDHFDNDVPSRDDGFFGGTPSTEIGEETWGSKFSAGYGFFGAFQVGWMFDTAPQSRFNARVELDFTTLQIRRNATSTIYGANGQALDKVLTEMGHISEHLTNISAQGLFLNTLLEFPLKGNKWIPYIGAGFGHARVRVDLQGQFVRKDNLPDKESTPLFDEVVISNTATLSEPKNTDTVFALQVLGGVDYALSDNFRIGIKLRWIKLENFKSKPTPYIQLRSHPSRVSEDGREVIEKETIREIEFFGVGLHLKYLF